MLIFLVNQSILINPISTRASQDLATTAAWVACRVAAAAVSPTSSRVATTVNALDRPRRPPEPRATRLADIRAAGRLICHPTALHSTIWMRPPLRPLTSSSSSIRPTTRIRIRACPTTITTCRIREQAAHRRRSTTFRHKLSSRLKCMATWMRPDSCRTTEPTPISTGSTKNKNKKTHPSPKKKI